MQNATGNSSSAYTRFVPISSLNNAFDIPKLWLGSFNKYKKSALSAAIYMVRAESANAQHSQKIRFN